MQCSFFKLQNWCLSALHKIKTLKIQAMLVARQFCLWQGKAYFFLRSNYVQRQQNILDNMTCRQHGLHLVKGLTISENSLNYIKNPSYVRFIWSLHVYEVYDSSMRFLSSSYEVFMIITWVSWYPCKRFMWSLKAVDTIT